MKKCKDSFDIMSSRDFKECLDTIKDYLTENNLTFSDLIDLSSLETVDGQILEGNMLSIQIFDNSLVS